METSEFDFDFLAQYISIASVTDINFNGVDLWIDDLEEGRYRADLKVESDAVYQLCIRFANVMNMQFNPQSPVVETDYKDVRISIIHPCLSKKVSLSIRKTTYMLRLNEQVILDTSYMSMSALKFLKYAVKSRCNIMVSGLPGAGKTELIKFLGGFIEPYERIITIEDSYELHYRRLYQKQDCVEIKVNDHFTYQEAIKASLRQRPNWLILSEVRSDEIVDLLTCISTGASVMSTIHAKSAHDIPVRISQMIPDERRNLSLCLGEAFNIGIHLDIRIEEDSVRRYVREIVVFSPEETQTIYTSKGKRLQLKVPHVIREKAEVYGVKW